METKTKAFLFGAAAALLLYPRKIESDRTGDTDGKKSVRLSVRAPLYDLTVHGSGEDRKVSLNLLPYSKETADKIRALSEKVRAYASQQIEKHKQDQRRPLFQQALDWVSKKGVADAGSLSRKFHVGVGCGEAFLEIMEDMGVVERRPDGKYRVVMPKKMIHSLIRN